MQVLSKKCLFFTIFAFGEDRMRLNNENKKIILFCIVFGFHYLCEKYRFNIEVNNNTSSQHQNLCSVCIGFLFIFYVS